MEREELPCERDIRETGREWVDPAPPLTRGDLVEMAKMCAGCPLRQECYDLGVKGERDIEGRFVAGATGMYGGKFFRRGRPMDPLALEERDDRRSVYFHTHWDRVRQQWRAQGTLGHVRSHILYSDDEDEAGRAADRWRRESEDRRGRPDDGEVAA